MDSNKENEHKINLKDLKKQELLSLEQIEKLINDVNFRNIDDKSKIVMEFIPTKPILKNLKLLNNFEGKLEAIQQYINAFEYNFTDLQLSTYQKKRTFSSMVDYAKILIKKSLPIRCLDGFILAAYLTCDIDKNCIRFPLRFLSKCEGKLYWHIVLAIKHNRNNEFGAIGISRKSEKLSFKKCKYDSLLSLIHEFIKSYEYYNHRVKMITIGVPLTTNIFSEDPIFWDILQISNKGNDNNVQKYSDILNQIFESFIKQKDIIFRSLTEGIKPYLFDTNVMFDNVNKKYFLKKQIKYKERQKERKKSQSITETTEQVNDNTKLIDINRV